MPIARSKSRRGAFVTAPVQLAGAATGQAGAAGALSHSVPLAGAAAAVAIAVGALSSPGDGGELTSFTLKSTAATGTQPFTVGLAFRKGDVFTSVATSLSTYQVVVKRTWSDGSIKHAIVSGRAALTQNVALAVTVASGVAPGGTDLTSASIQTAAPTASVQCGSFGTVSLASLLASPFRTWISGPEMVECHYRADVGGGTLLSVWFHVRLFADGRMWVRAICENGYLDNGAGAIAANADRSFVPTVSVGGTNVYTNGGASLSTYGNTRWTAEGWIGGSPQVTATHAAAYLRATKLVPEYGWTSPSETAFTTFITQGAPQAWAADYTPMAAGDTDGNMGSTGYGPFIGLLPLWNALYATSGDARALRYTLNNSSALNSRYIVWRDKTTNLVPRPSDFATWNYAAATGGGGADTITTPASLGWDQPHHPGEGYLAYLLTGDYWHYETMAMNASLNYLIMSANRGNGTSRLMRHTQVRGTAWMVRTVGCYAAIAPTGDAVAADYRDWLSIGGYDYFWSLGPGASGLISQLGYIFTIGAPNGPLTIPPWMQHFWVAINGFLWDIEPGFADTTKHRDVRDFMYRAVVGIMGGQDGAGGNTFSYASASMYDGLEISQTNYAPGGTDLGIVVSASGFSATWGDLWRNTDSGAGGGGGSSNYTLATALGGTSGGSPNLPNGYWSNLLPALAYAVEHGAPGAQACYNRLKAASNWSALNTSGFDDTPLWGIKPRGDPAAVLVPYTLPTSANSSTQVGLNSVYAVKPSSHADSQMDETMFAAYSCRTYVPTYNAAGLILSSNTGGHANIAMNGAAGWNVLNALWEYHANANGIVESPNPHATAELNNATMAELTVATSGQYPANPHGYGSQIFYDYGIRGSVGWLGRGSVSVAGPDTSPSCHWQSCSSWQWVRFSDDVLAYQGLECGAAHDPTTNRYYSTVQQFHNQNKLAYLDASARTIGQTAPYAFPTLPGGYCRAFVVDEQRAFILHVGGQFWGLNLNTPEAGLSLLSVSGVSVPTTGNQWTQKWKGARWYKESDTGNVLHKFVPGSNVLGGTGVMSTVTIAGAGIPNFFGTEAGHENALQVVPVPLRDSSGTVLPDGALFWIPNGQQGTVTVINAS